MQIRTFKVDEYKDILRFERTIWGDNPDMIDDTSSLKDMLKGGMCLGAFVGDKLVSICLVDVADDDLTPKTAEDEYHIYDISVLPEYRGKGIAKSLIITTLANLKDLPMVKKLTLWVAPDNESAIKLYESVGFKYTGANAKLDNEIKAKYIKILDK